MTLVLLSGGLDSTVLAAHLCAGPHPPEAVSVHYGQRHAKELDAAAAVCAALGIQHTTVNLSVLAPHLTSALTGGGGHVPHGHYTADTMSSTVVPGRNAILLTVAAGIAAARGHTSVATAVHGGDHHVYPDCRPEFVNALDTALTAGYDVRVLAPFVGWSKADVVAYGATVATSALLELTWSCYEGGAAHCGRCGTCVERAEAFDAAGVPDPTTYDDPTYWRTQIATTRSEQP